MSRHSKEKREAKIEKVLEEVKEAELSEKSKEIAKERQAEEARRLTASLDSEKANKDALLMNVKELTQHIIDQKKELQNVNLEIENKYLALKNLDNEIKAQNYNVSRQKEKFDKENAEQLRIMTVKQAEIDKSDAEYKKLIIEVNQMKNDLGNQLKAIYDERISHKNELTRLNRHVNDIEAEISKAKADIADREEALKEAKKLFEQEKDAIQPEFKRVSAIKNENSLLLQKIDDAQAQIKRQEANMDAYKLKLDADAEAGKQALARQQLAVQNSEARLRKWEQDLNDQALEIRAREVEAQKMIKKYQLLQTIESNKE